MRFFKCLYQLFKYGTSYIGGDDYERVDCPSAFRRACINDVYLSCFTCINHYSSPWLSSIMYLAFNMASTVLPSLRNRKKLMLVQIMNSVDMNCRNIVNSGGKFSYSVAMNSIVKE